MKPRALPSEPWDTVSVDFVKVEGCTFLSCIDLYSHCPKMVLMRNTDTEATIDALSSIFARFVLPRRIIIDNGPPFQAEAFNAKLAEWSVKHEVTAPYAPWENPVERFHRTLRNKLAKIDQHTSLKYRIREVLRTIRSTACTPINACPGDVLLRGKYRTPLRTLPLTEATPQSDEEDWRERDTLVKTVSKDAYDKRKNAKHPNFKVGDKVFVSVPKQHPFEGEIVGTKGNHEVLVRDSEGNDIRRHPNAVQRLPDETPDDSNVLRAQGPNDTTPKETRVLTNIEPHPPPGAPPIRRSQRQRFPPDRLTYS